jgi:tripartite-type tricarboxylate transporter receptor subunit TctC
MIRRMTLSLAAALVALEAPALAQDYPNRAIRIIVQTAPGGLIDQIGRTFAQKVTENTGKVAVVENRTGGGGLIAAEHVLSSPPDGYTVYVASHGSQAIHPHLTKLSFDPVKAFAPVIYLATTPTLLVMHPSVPAKTLQELIALLKANPGKYTYASQGNGSSGHVTAEQFRQLTGVDIVHVPYKGAAPAVRDLVAGHVALMFDTVAFSQEQVSAGKLRAVAVGADARVKSLPDVPTMAEAGLPAMQGSPWFGLVVAAGTPRPVIDWLNREATRAFTAKDVQDRFDAQAFTLPLGSPEAFAAHIATESKRWGEVIRRGNISLK